MDQARRSASTAEQAEAAEAHQATQAAQATETEGEPMTHPTGPAGTGPGGGAGNGPGRETTTFEFGDLPLRTVTVGGEPWFVAADVCAVLGISNGRDAVSRLDPTEKGVGETDTPGGRQRMTVVSEPGLYRLVMRSNKPDAVRFQMWIAHEVLPALRRTGRYEITPAVAALPQSYAEALRELAASVEETERVKTELAEAAPKAHSWDTLASGDGDYSVGDAAKILSRDPVIAAGERRLFTVLAEQGWIYRQRADQRWRVYQTAVERNWLSELPSSHYHPRTGELVLDPPQVRVTPKGLAELHRRLGGLQPLRVYEQTALPAPKTPAASRPEVGAAASTSAAPTRTT